MGRDLDSEQMQGTHQSFAARQRRLRGIVVGVAGAMLLLLIVALARRQHATETTAAVMLPVALSNSVEAVPVASVVAVSAPPVVTRNLIPTEATLVTVPANVPTSARAPASAETRPMPEKIAHSERKSAAAISGVSRPQSNSAFDAPFVPPR